jgi:hypothetical protein
MVEFQEWKRWSAFRGYAHGCISSVKIRHWHSETDRDIFVVVAWDLKRWLSQANNGNDKNCQVELDNLSSLTLSAEAKILEFSDSAKAPAGEDEYNQSTTIAVAVIVIVVTILSLVVVAIVWVRRHRAFDDVYGTAGGRAVYGNPAYGAPPGAGGDGYGGAGYLDVGKSFEYPKSQSSKTEKKGLVRQESLC